MICAGETTQLGGDPNDPEKPTAKGGKEPYTYIWTPASSLSCSDCPYPIATPTDPETVYELTVVDADGFTCSEIVEVLAPKIEIANAASERAFNYDIYDTQGIVELRLKATELGNPNDYDSLRFDWTSYQKIDVTPNDPWDDHTGTIQFQRDPGEAWGNEVERDGETKVKMRAMHPGRAFIRVTFTGYKDGKELVCSDEKEISVPQFFRLNYNSPNVGSLQGDLKLVGLQNESHWYFY